MLEASAAREAKRKEEDRLRLAKLQAEKEKEEEALRDLDRQVQEDLARKAKAELKGDEEHIAKRKNKIPDKLLDGITRKERKARDVAQKHEEMQRMKQSPMLPSSK